MKTTFIIYYFYINYSIILIFFFINILKIMIKNLKKN